MKIEDAVGQISKQYLNRIIQSFTKDWPTLEETEARRKIIENAPQLADLERIKGQLKPEEQQHTLLRFIIEVLLGADDFALTEKQIYEELRQKEQEICDAANQTDVFRYKDAEKLRTYKVVLEVALQDRHLSPDEIRLLSRLRIHLGLHHKDHFILQAQLGHFPQYKNKLHTAAEVNSALTSLQKKGIAFYCNQAPGDALHTLPDELVPAIREALSIELDPAPYRILLKDLSRQHLKQILNTAGLPISGAKDDQVDRIVNAGLSPSDVLQILSVDDLYQICKSLPGVNVSGSKSDRIKNIIDHYGSLKAIEVTKDGDPRIAFYDFFELLARRDRQNLLANRVIKKDLDIEHAFEAATKYLFEEKLGATLMEQQGTKHPDGAIELQGELLMWDNKSTEEPYTFPNSHLDQFKRYIRDSEKRVSCFLVVGQDIANDCLGNAFKLKAESHQDTDVALISAEDLKWLAEKWTSQSKNGQSFNMQVLNYTGVLTRQLLEQRMSVFCK